MKHNIYKIAQLFNCKLKALANNSFDSVKRMRDAANKLHLLKDLWITCCGMAAAPIVDAIKAKTFTLVNTVRMYGFDTDQMTDQLNQLTKLINDLVSLPRSEALDPMASGAVATLKDAMREVADIMSGEIAKQLGM